ncbi:hypothetical protein ABK040_008477 [Willaertia magna]
MSKQTAASTIASAQQAIAQENIATTQQIEFDDEFVKKMENSPPVSEVSIDAMVLLKMINHCTEKVPTQVTGQLLGLDNGGVLEITNSFPFPSTYSDNLTDEERNVEDDRYQIDMLQCLAEVNVDNNTVGWYQSTYFESFMNLTTIDSQYQYQKTLGNKRCIHLVFDPLRTRRGELFVKAYRLTDKFIDAVRLANAQQIELTSMKRKMKQTDNEEEVILINQQLPESIDNIHITQEILATLEFNDNDIFEELPIQIHNYALVQAFLLDFEQDDKLHLLSNYDSLDLNGNLFLTRGLNSLIECSDTLSHEQHRYQQYQKKLTQQKQYMAKKKDKSQEEQELALKSIQQPNQLSYLMVANQLNNTCNQMKDFANQSIHLGKLSEILMKRDL